MSKNSPLVFLSLCVILLLPLLIVGQEKKTEKAIPDYSLNDRKDVPVEYTWKIEDLFSSVDAWQAEKETVTRLITQVDEKAKGWTASAQAMLAILDQIDQIDQKSSRLTSYASHQSNTDMGNTLYQGLEGDLRSILVQLNSKLAFLQPDVLALGAEKFAAYIMAEP
jgi:oligoendopeptidase F